MNFEIPEFGRCCFCLPLRRGVVTFGYINALWSAIMIFMVAHYNPWFLAYFGFYVDAYVLGWEIQIGFYSCDIIFSIILIFGAHLNKTSLLKTFVYYIITSVTLIFLFKFVELCSNNNFWETLTFVTFLLSSAFNLFIAMICWNLIKKIERETPSEGYQNPLQQFVDGEVKESSENKEATNNGTVEVPIELTA